MLDKREESDIDSERDEGDESCSERCEGREEGDGDVSGEGKEESDERHAGSNWVNSQAASPAGLYSDRVTGLDVPENNTVSVSSGAAVATPRFDTTIGP